ncbi:MAG: hypothetical protein R3C54_16185 [Parvularculaceae bacterium]
MRIIVTRPSPDAEALRRLPVKAEFSQCSRLSWRSTSESATIAQSSGALAFTSANGVRAFCGLSGDRSLPVFAVGAMTAQGPARRV